MLILSLYELGVERLERYDCLNFDNHFWIYTGYRAFRWSVNNRASSGLVYLVAEVHQTMTLVVTTKPW